jgi:hypothetical protein
MTTNTVHELLANLNKVHTTELGIGFVITINAQSFTIITAHQEKK